MNFTNDFSKEIWEINYKYDKEKCIDDSFRRVAKAIASVEKDLEYWEEKFYWIMSNGYFSPAGRILANAGTHYKTTLFNCFTSPIPSSDADSIEGIQTTLLKQMQTLKSEGGYGHNFSWMRPRGSFIEGIGVESPGAVKFMELFNKSSEIITSGSGEENKNKYANKLKKEKIRKGAQLGVLFNNHPDIEEFITAKRIANKLDKFNVSVGCYDDFMNKVVRVEETGVDEVLDLIFPDTESPRYKNEWDGDINLWVEKGYPYKVYKSISVKRLWELIMKSTYDNNDPGIIFTDRANFTFLANYLGKRIQNANPCGEQTMPPASVCDLGSIVWTSFIIPNTYHLPWYKRIRWTILSEVVEIAVRFLDNVNDYSDTPCVEYKKSAKEMRRIGLGDMGWGSFLYLLGVKFASDEAEEIKDRVKQTIVMAAIETSIGLAKEKGSFVGCNNEKVANHNYFKQINLSEEIRKKIKKYGLRNSALFSDQPNGNTSSLHNINSGGIEPIFLHSWIRTMIVQSPPDNIVDICPKYWMGEYNETAMFKWTKEGKEEILRGIDNDGIVWKIDKGRGLTKEILCEDYSVYVLKKDGQWDESADWAVTTETLSVQEHLRDLTSWAKWTDAAISKTVNVPNDYPYEDFKKIYLDAYKNGTIKGITTYRSGTMCNVLAAVEDKNKIVKTNSPERPKDLQAKVFFPSIKNQRYCVAIGLYGADPYELFALKIEDKHATINEAIIRRVKQGHYQIIHNEEVFLDDISNKCDHIEEAISRLCSTSLRHGVDIKFLNSQLEKTKGDLYSLGHIISRILRKFIPDNTKAGEKCPECSENLLHLEGCLKCICGFSKC